MGAITDMRRVGMQCGDAAAKLDRATVDRAKYGTQMDYAKAAKAIEPMARGFLLANYDASGLGRKSYGPGGYVHSGWLRSGIASAHLVVTRSQKARLPLLRMEMADTVKPPHDTRQWGGIKASAALNFGAVRGGKISRKGKARLKASGTGGGMHRLTKAYHFFKFTPEQLDRLRSAFLQAVERAMGFETKEA